MSNLLIVSRRAGQVQGGSAFHLEVWGRPARAARTREAGAGDRRGERSQERIRKGERERASTRKERERPEERSRRRRHLLSCLRRHQSQIRATERERFATFRRRSSLSLLTHVKCPRHAQVSGRPLLPSRRPTLVIPKQILLRLL